MPLIGAINSLSTGSHTVTRQSPGTYVQGRYTPGTESTFTVVASVQPVTGRDLQDLPEGQYANEVKKLYTAVELRTRHPDSEPDRINIYGETYTVIQVNRWDGFGDKHYKVLVSRREVP
jgi:hypothetical protein